MNVKRRNSDGIFEYKIILLGEKAVGKSSIISRFILNSFDHEIQSTVGTAFYAKTMQSKNKLVKLMIWDTCGEERFRSISSMHFKDADAAILVYDLAEPKTINGVIHYMDALKDDSPEDVMVNVIGNKCD